MLRAKDVEFEVTYINLREKPDWFLKISPHGKVPVLNVDDSVLFESNAIAEFLDETTSPQLHPSDPFKRARNRAWTDFVPEFSRQLGSVTYAKTAEDLDVAMQNATIVLGKLEHAMTNERPNDGPYFNGDALSLVDAAYAPFLMRFSIAEKYLQCGLLQPFPNIQRWTDHLLQTDAVVRSVSDEFNDVFAKMLKVRKTLAAEMMAAK